MTNSSYVRYLLTLSQLYSPSGIKSVDIAHALNVTKTSVHNMMNTFMELNYVEKERRGLIFMTPQGIQMANQYKAQYDTIREKLFADCMTDASAEKAICSMIADLSEESCKIIMREYSRKHSMP